MADTAVVEDTEVTETEDEQAESTETETEKAVPTEVESLATDMGWAPEDEWRGDPDKWVDAKTFIKAGPEILKSSLRRQDTEIAEVRKTLGEFKEHHQKVDKRAYDRAVADLEAKQRDAVAEGDTEAFDRVAGEIKDLEKPSDTPVAAQNNDNDPEFIRFQAANAWYNDDYRLTGFANEIAQEVARRGFSGAAFYDEIARAVRVEYPDRFRNKARKEPARVDGGGERRPGRSTAKTYSDLPADAKAACDGFVKEGLLTKEAYVKEFFEDES